MGVCMFSSAGIPPTAGFIGKLYVFRAAVDVGIRSNEAAIAAQQQLGITEPTSELSLIGLTILAVLFSVAGIYYYLKVLVYMYMKKQQREIRALEHSSLKFALVVCAVLTLYLGIFPGQAVQLSREALVDFKGTPPSVQAVQQRGAEELEVLERRQRLAEAGMLDQGAEGEEAAAEGEAREQ
jgi:NADH-quinone oxidoreductase subunit N